MAKKKNDKLRDLERKESKKEPDLDDTYSKGKSAIEPEPDLPPLSDYEEAGKGKPEDKETTQNMAGETAAALFTSLIEGAAGDRFKATPAETESLRIGFTDFFDARGIEKIPPNISLGAGMLAYLLPRVLEIRKEHKAKVQADIIEMEKKKQAGPFNPESGHYEKEQS